MSPTTHDQPDTSSSSCHPRWDKHSTTDLKVPRTETHQVFGTWSGTITDDTRRQLRLDGIQGLPRSPDPAGDHPAPEAPDGFREVVGRGEPPSENMATET